LRFERSLCLTIKSNLLIKSRRTKGIRIPIVSAIKQNKKNNKSLTLIKRVKAQYKEIPGVAKIDFNLGIKVLYLISSEILGMSCS
jgi:hypothetical protein